VDITFLQNLSSPVFGWKLQVRLETEGAPTPRGKAINETTSGRFPLLDYRSKNRVFKVQCRLRVPPCDGQVVRIPTWSPRGYVETANRTSPPCVSGALPNGIKRQRYNRLVGFHDATLAPSPERYDGGLSPFKRQHATDFTSMSATTVNKTVLSLPFAKQTLESPRDSCSVMLAGPQRVSKPGEGHSEAKQALRSTFCLQAIPPQL